MKNLFFGFLCILISVILIYLDIIIPGPIWWYFIDIGLVSMDLSIGITCLARYAQEN
jgi:hypothetical protein